MRYQMTEQRFAWAIVDTLEWDVILSASKDFPDAEFLVRTQCDFLNQSPATKAA